MRARIYQPARNAMTSGTARTRHWILEFTPEHKRKLDPLMGWTGTEDTDPQVRLRFASRDEAVDYARAHGIDFDIAVPHKRKPNIRPGGYGENFATNRRFVWTH